MKQFSAVTVIAIALLIAVECCAFNCSISTTPVNFPLYDVLSFTPLDSSGSITVTCTNPPVRPITVTVTVSAGSSGNFPQRQMKPTSGSGALLYNLYTTSAMTMVIGDGSGGTIAPFNVVTRPQAWTIPLYGRIPARQNLPPGIYSDALTATVIW